MRTLLVKKDASQRPELNGGNGCGALGGDEILKRKTERDGGQRNNRVDRWEDFTAEISH